MPPRVYVETTVISYLAARPSRDLITAARQQVTHEWWRRRRSEFEIYVSQLVLDEASAGDPAAAARRAALMSGLPLLDVTPAAAVLARRLVDVVGLPPQAGTDALHIATAACHGTEYLLTWNVAYIANAEHCPRVERACRAEGYEPPVLCTPDEQMNCREEGHAVNDENDREAPWEDPIVAEVRAARAALFAAAGHDLEVLVDRLRREQLSSGHRVVAFPRRTPETTGGAVGD